MIEPLEAKRQKARKAKPDKSPKRKPEALTANPETQIYGNRRYFLESSVSQTEICGHPYNPFVIRKKEETITEQYSSNFEEEYCGFSFDFAQVSDNRWFFDLIRL